MAKTPASDAIMPADKMRPLLALSKKEPVHAAFALSSDGEAVLLLDKKAAPRKVMSMLRASADKAKLKLASPTVRFGRAEVDVDYDPGIVRMFINKDGSDALRMKLTEVVKRIAYHKVEFTVDPALEAEDEAGAAAQPAGEAAAGPEVPPPAAPDLGELKRRLVASIGAIAAETDPARKAMLAQLAGLANAAFKAQDAAATDRLLGNLQAAIDSKPAAAPPTPSIAPDKLLALFRDAKDEVDDGLTRLQQALRETGDTDLLRIADFGLYGMSEGTGVGLMKSLFDLQGATPANRDTLLSAARDAAQAYRSAVFADGAIDLVDGNPFGVTVGIRAKLGHALDQIAKAA